MKVCVEPVGLYSRAMVRIANALTRYAPSGVEITGNRDDADLIVMYVIGADALEGADAINRAGKYYAAVQCCLLTAGVPDLTGWVPFWKQAAAVWSYYDLSKYADLAGVRFYHAPLGLDDAFRTQAPSVKRQDLVITSGFVSDPKAEAIDEVWHAAHYLSLDVMHIGPKEVTGITARGPQLRRVRFCRPDDLELARLYSTARFVASMRHVEGFELPAAEGLALGARPIVFDQPTMRRWYGNHVIYAPDISGKTLVDWLKDAMRNHWHWPNDEEQEHARRSALTRFDWKPLCEGFWGNVLRGLKKEVT